jgi:hypothetical protein
MTYRTNDYSLGSKVVLSPDQQQTISNQYKRYMKALEYTSDSVKFEKPDPDSGLTLDARFIRPDSQQFTANAESFDYRVTARVIDSSTVALQSTTYAVKVEGRTVKSLGRYFYTIPNNQPLTPEQLLEAQGKGIDGQYTVLNDQGQSIALVTTVGEIVPIGTPETVVQSIATGRALGYRCTCPDYLGQQADLLPTLLGEQQKVFGVLGSRGICKHVMSVRLIRGDVVSVPQAPPTLEPESNRKVNWTGVKEVSNRGGKGRVKWV